MHLIDTHTHIYGEDFDADILETLARSAAAGVKTLLFPAIDPESNDRQQRLWERVEQDKESPVRCYQMMGLHPTSVKENYREWLEETRQLLFANPDRYVGVGEIGLDYYWDRTYEKEQIEVLTEQIGWAKSLDKALCLHVRKAYEEVLHLLKDLNYATYRGVMHCFGGGTNQALRSIEMGFYIGIGGVVTFKNAGMAQVVKDIPLERIVLETDSPYLAPVPYRGKRNESAYILDIAKKVAEIKELPLEAVAEQTTHNAQELFGII